ncbi:hypothetical protein TCAL_08388 [Tigriopus californicus]|uniref:C3H1-type domain-containing protein n=1 Tax=Tigriopus californicus TaxID=6832 RepID=A0A553PBA7_TIGCA|nr:uncharacterized protein LOC131892624 [Tigriopus californicus]TRY74974.1 hypothetical protein TCAL_08388 [Tigriopus californicus]|eukprot:TCALIF_08388-PA protein Name:"Similar to tdrd1 Tudor domain-containing protein 1 (Oryzias latipes)" AED:0.00 eAED:0.00 QI:205/1/1/1/1/1/4/122/784
MAEKVTFLNGTPKSFYVRTESQSQEVARLEHELLERYGVPGSGGVEIQDKCRLSKKDRLKPGFSFGIQYKDVEGRPKFGRVILADILTEDDVTVSYLDLSYVAVVGIKSLLRLPKQLRAIPPQVTFCTMFEYINSDLNESNLFEKVWQMANTLYMVRLPDEGSENTNAPIPVRLVADIDVSSIIKMNLEAPVCLQEDPKHSLKAKSLDDESLIHEMSDCGCGDEAVDLSRVSSWLEDSSLTDKEPSKVPTRHPKISKISDLPPLTVTTNEQGAFKFLFAHIESPGRFFVHPWEDTQGVFESFLLDLNQFYSENGRDASHKIEGHIRQDSLVAVYSESTWNRGCLKEHVDADLKKVFMIDHGDTVEAPTKDLRVLDKKFCAQAPLARECSLEGVQVVPAKLPQAVSLMNEQSDLFGQKSWFIGVPDDVENNIMSLDVLAQEFENDDGSIQPTLSLNAFLVAKEVCLSDTHPQTLDWNPIGDDYAAGDNFYDSASRQQYPKQVGARFHGPQICRFFQNSGRCMKGDACPDYHLFTGSNAYTEIDRDKTMTAAYNEITLPSKESDTCIQVSSIQSPSNFYIILPWGPIDINQANLDIFESAADQEQNLEVLCSEMTRYYNRIDQTSKRVQSKFIRTEIVAAFCSHEKQWLRAKILDVPLDQEDHSTLTVFFVDFGNSQDVALKSIRKIQPAFLHLPFQALQCSLSGVKPLGDLWTKEATEYFFQLVHDKTFLASIECVNPNWPLQLTLRDMKTSEETVVQALIKSGFGDQCNGGIIGLNTNSKYIPG